MSVTLPDNVAHGKNVETETEFHMPPHSFLILLLILIDLQPRFFRDCESPAFY